MVVQFELCCFHLRALYWPVARPTLDKPDLCSYEMKTPENSTVPFNCELVNDT